MTRSTSSRAECLLGTLAERAATAAGRLIEAVDPGPGPDIPGVPLDTLLDDADSSGVAAGPDRAAEAGLGAPRCGPR